MNNTLQKAQALVTLLLFVVISVTITSGAIIILLLNSKSTTKLSQADICTEIAESGVENALLRLERNPSYTGETIALDGGATVIQVTQNANVYTITSSASLANYRKTVQATASLSNNVFSVTSWQQF